MADKVGGNIVSATEIEDLIKQGEESQKAYVSISP
jgi:hypothetical protein